MSFNRRRALTRIPPPEDGSIRAIIVANIVTSPPYEFWNTPLDPLYAVILIYLAQQIESHTYDTQPRISLFTGQATSLKEVSIDYSDSFLQKFRHPGRYFDCEMPIRHRMLDMNEPSVIFQVLQEASFGENRLPDIIAELLDINSKEKEKARNRKRRKHRETSPAKSLPDN